MSLWIIMQRAKTRAGTKRAAMHRICIIATYRNIYRFLFYSKFYRFRCSVIILGCGFPGQFSIIFYEDIAKF